MTRQIDFDDLTDVLLDVKGVEVLLIHLESSAYLKISEEDILVLRAIRNSLEHTQSKLKYLLENYNDSKKNG